MGVAISTLTNVNWSAMSDGQPLPAATLNSGFNNANLGVNQLQGVVQDLEKSYAGASAPTDKPAGKWWYDSTNQRMQYYPTTGGTLVIVPKVFSEAAGTPGTTIYGLPDVATRTINVSGVDQNSYVSGTGTAGTDNTAQIVKQITLKANSLNAVKRGIRLTVFGTKSGSGTVLATVYLGTAGTTSDQSISSFNNNSAGPNPWYITATILFLTTTSIANFTFANMLNGTATIAGTSTGLTTNINTAADMIISVGQGATVADHLIINAMLVEQLG